jgi:hypothetical protein
MPARPSINKILNLDNEWAHEWTHALTAFIATAGGWIGV